MIYELRRGGGAAKIGMDVVDDVGRENASHGEGEHRVKMIALRAVLGIAATMTRSAAPCLKRACAELG